MKLSHRPATQPITAFFGSYEFFFSFTQFSIVEFDILEIFGFEMEFRSHSAIDSFILVDGERGQKKNNSNKKAPSSSFFRYKMSPYAQAIDFMP